ncbi:hypothetical protein QRX50_25845 [Amycolatopsis carbonis]|uniref:Secreted protein n=1 Tax=Amycolatopsis carbonis TaxID=715471 RepID=A0A9Y2I9F7_9PSEU|nr:hypothetical protein [Amycolatopsis sp. 2-15]WIX74985.1 hypothetical protein QRX50_25845 [Amycolatopsis sp. 2-15]
MPTWLIVVIVVVAVVVIGAVAWLVVQERQRKRLQQQFGPEYSRAVEENDSPRAAQRELAERERRHRDLDIRPLSASARERYAQHWALIQEKFVDQPAGALDEADDLLVAVMSERGYPTEGFDQQLSDLSVRHSRTLEHYRAAHETHRRHAETALSTEELRSAMVHYRTVFEDLLTDDTGAESRSDTRTDTRTGSRTDERRPEHTAARGSNHRSAHERNGEH